MKIDFGYREKLIAAAAGLVLVAVGWYFFVYNAFENKIVNMKTEIAQIQNDLSKTANSQPVITKLREDIDSLRAQLRAGQERILPKDRLVYITQEIESMAEEHNLTVHRITLEKETLFAEAAPEQFVLPLPIQIILSGKFFEFGRFLEHIKNAPFLMHTAGVEISTDDEMYPDLGVQLVTYVYVYR